MTVDHTLIIEALSRPMDPRKPWMTARMLACRLGMNQGSRIKIEESLLKYYKKSIETNAKLLIRYSSLPSKKTLEVLWGHIDHVGQRKLLDIKKTDVADDSLEIDPEVKYADVFISHSFKDYVDVIKIAKLLQSRNIKPWLAETHIQQGEHIHEEVINALGRTKYLILFLSENSLLSRWTGKEYLYAVSKGIQVIVIADCRSLKINSIIKGKLIGDGQFIEEGSGDSMNFFHDLISDKENIVKFIIYPENKLQELGADHQKNIFYSIQQLASLIK